jgi:2-amino-4-hydroxy-6-hydroxymethyldihydropteridine diphosphokinase
MAIVYLALGSNVGDCQANLCQAVQLIEERMGSLISLSALYETAPWGFTSSNDFLNSVLELETPHSPTVVLEIAKGIEVEMGRTQKSNSEEYKDRVIDIDILFYNNDIINEIDLKIPHPLLHLRSFVLEPLVEIAPDFIHPVLHKSILQLYKATLKKENPVNSEKY